MMHETDEAAGGNFRRPNDPIPPPIEPRDPHTKSYQKKVETRQKPLPVLDSETQNRIQVFTTIFNQEFLQNQDAPISSGEIESLARLLFLLNNPEVKPSRTDAVPARFQTQAVAEAESIIPVLREYFIGLFEPSFQVMREGKKKYPADVISPLRLIVFLYAFGFFGGHQRNAQNVYDQLKLQGYDALRPANVNNDIDLAFRVILHDVRKVLESDLTLQILHPVTPKILNNPRQG
jgi:hypothetical protein